MTFKLASIAACRWLCNYEAHRAAAELSRSRLPRAEMAYSIDALAELSE